MIDGTRPANPGDAKIYMREVKEGLDKINNMIAIA